MLPGSNPGCGAAAGVTAAASADAGDTPRKQLKAPTTATQASTARDLAAGLWPYNLDVTPDGRLALTADNGNAGVADSNIDTVSVIDLEASRRAWVDFPLPSLPSSAM